MRQQTVNVWDPLVRLFHWSLVVSFAVAWVTAEDWADLHHWAGYAAAVLILFRLVWGFIGSRYARFRQFLKGPRETLNYLAKMLKGEEPRYIGHNPAGSLMIVGLVIVVSITSLTGWMYTLDAYWGVEWVEQLHELMANLMLVMVAAHVIGVVYASFRHHENLVKSMLSGKKRNMEDGDIA